MAKIKKKEVEQTLSPCESIDRYLANENATHHSSTQNFEMQAKRDLLEFLYVNDSKQREYLSKRVKMPPRSFRRNMKILEEKGTLERKKGSGRPLQISGNEKKRLCQIALKSPSASTQNVCDRYNELARTSVSKSTVFRALKLSGVQKKTAKIIPNITPVHEQKRIEFCRTWKNFNFGETWLSDECMFQLHRNKIKLWSSYRKTPRKGFPKFSPKIMVWGAISSKGFYMKIIERGTIDSSKYCEIVGDFIPYATALFPDGWILEQDGATPHTSRKTKDFFAENSVQFLQWPPNSPDINPVENVWMMLKSFVEKKNPKTKDELIQYVQESQHVILPAVRKNLMGSIPTRLGQCLENEGKFVEKWTGTE